MKPMRFAGAAAGLIVSLAVVSNGAAGPERITDATVAVLQSWIHAVKTHTPGRVDESVTTVAAFSYETREELNTSLDLFFAPLVGRIYDTKKNKAAETIVALGHAVGTSFLKQAAVFHSDVAAYGDRFPVHSTDSPKAAAQDTQELQVGRGMSTPLRIERADPIPPLLTRNRLLLDQDGEVLGEVVASWNWPFARSLLDLLDARRAPTRVPGTATAADPFVAAWYHATAAYMFASGTYGDLRPHLQRAADVLPDDALILFDRGCYAELLGLPMHQALLSERDVIDLKRGPGPAWTKSRSATALGIPAADKTNAEAERSFRRALAIDPSFVEARVRFARLLDLRRRSEEAATELKAALAENPGGVVAFYAHLFAGRAAQAMGHADEAARHYRNAIALFPDAQSALLASSQLALAGADVPAALASVQRLGVRSAVFTADPWWQYQLCAGRDADDLLKAVWARVPR